MEPDTKPLQPVPAIKRYQAALAAFDERQTEAIALSDERVSAKRVLIEAQEKYDKLSEAQKDIEAAIGLLRYSVECSRADLEAELRESTAHGVVVQAIISY